MQQLISAARVDKIRAALDAAGQQWESEARRFPEVDGTTHGDAETRDLAHLRRSWGMSVINPSPRLKPGDFQLGPHH